MFSSEILHGRFVPDRGRHTRSVGLHARGIAESLSRPASSYVSGTTVHRTIARGVDWVDDACVAQRNSVFAHRLDSQNAAAGNPRPGATVFAKERPAPPEPYQSPRAASISALALRSAVVESHVRWLTCGLGIVDMNRFFLHASEGAVESRSPSSISAAIPSGVGTLVYQRFQSSPSRTASTRSSWWAALSGSRTTESPCSVTARGQPTRVRSSLRKASYRARA